MFWNWKSPLSVFRILQQCSAGQPCDIPEIGGYGSLVRAGGIRWPFSQPLDNASPPLPV